MGIIETSLSTPAIRIIISVAINADKYVPNGTKITIDKMANAAISWYLVTLFSENFIINP